MGLAHASCIEELGALVIAYAQINAFFADLKRGVASVRPGKSEAQLDEDYFGVHESLELAFERASTEFLSAEWPKNRRDVWKANHENLRVAVVAYTERLASLLNEYKSQ